MKNLVIVLLILAVGSFALAASRNFESHGGHMFVPVSASAAQNLKLAMDSIAPKFRPPVASPREFPTSTPGVSYVLKPDGTVEFRVRPNFQGVAITPDGRNLYLAN